MKKSTKRGLLISIGVMIALLFTSCNQVQREKKPGGDKSSIIGDFTITETSHILDKNNNGIDDRKELFTPKNISELRELIHTYIDDKSPGGFLLDPNMIDVSQIVTMRGLFYGMDSFNSDISGWNVSQVTDMSGMFGRATSFNQDISKWNISKVTDMSGMFAGATSFNQDISKWNISKVTDMSGMFAGATSFNQNISNWNVSDKDTLDMMYEVLMNKDFEPEGVTSHE